MNARDLCMPEYRFYHGRLWEHYRELWVITGNPQYLSQMEEFIMYVDDKSRLYGSTSWSSADDWQDQHVFGCSL